MPSRLRRITSTLQKGQQNQSPCTAGEQPNKNVDEPSMENQQRRRFSSDDMATTPVNENFSPLLDSIYSDEPNQLGQSDDDVPQPIITRRRRAPITRKSITNGITDEEYKIILKYQALHKLAEADNNYVNGDTSSGDEEHKISGSRRDTNVRHSLPVKGFDKEYLERIQRKESDHLFQMVPKLYKPNLRIISNDRQFVRVEIDELSFKCMMKDLGEVCEQHNYKDSTETLVMQGTGSLPRRKKSSVEMLRRAGTLGKKSGQFWKQPESPGSVVRFNAGHRKSDATQSAVSELEILNQVPTEKIETPNGPWVEVKLRQEDYTNFITVITRDPKSSHVHHRQRFILNYINIRFVYYTSMNSKYSFSRPSKSMGTILNYSVPLSDKIKDDVSYPIIIPGIPLTFAKIAEHIWTLENIYKKSLEKSSMDDPNAENCPYNAYSSEDLSASYLDISSISSKPNNNSAPSTPVIARSPVDEFQRAKLQGMGRQFSEDAASSRKVITEGVPKMRKRDRSKNVIRNSTKGLQRVTGRIMDMANGTSPSVAT